SANAQRLRLRNARPRAAARASRRSRPGEGRPAPSRAARPADGGTARGTRAPFVRSDPAARAPPARLEERVEPDGEPRRERREPLEREQDARRERLARGRVVPDRQRLPRSAEDHLLVRDEPG